MQKSITRIKVPSPRKISAANRKMSFSSFYVLSKVKKQYTITVACVRWSEGEDSGVAKGGGTWEGFRGHTRSWISWCPLYHETLSQSSRDRLR